MYLSIIYLSAYLSIYLPIYLPTYLPTYLPIYLSTLECLIEGEVLITLGRGVGVGKFLKFYSQVRVEQILFDTLKPNTKKLKCFGLVSLFKNNKFLNQMHSFLLDINIKQEQNETGMKLQGKKLTIKNSNYQQRNTFNKIISTYIRLLMRNVVNNWE